MKNVYITNIQNFDPDYSIEKYTGMSSYLNKNNIVYETLDPVVLELSPLHIERPGICVYYIQRKELLYLSAIENIHSITIWNDDIIKMRFMNSQPEFMFQLSNKYELESFVTLIGGYYRLMVNWNINLCQELETVKSIALKRLKCYGPIGSDKAFEILKCIPGKFIVYQSDVEYNVYFVDEISNL